MTQTRNCCLMLSLCAGAATGLSAAEPATLSPGVGEVMEVAHIYYNAATGDRVVTVVGGSQSAGADTGDSELIWSVVAQSQCLEAGYTTEYFFGLDDNSPTTMGGEPTPLATMAEMADWGDLSTDTVVDCVTINWVTDHDDTDTDGDEIGDGVPGLAGQWTVWDADNGAAIDASTRLPLASFILTDLPADFLSPGDDTAAAAYTADIDLVSTFDGADLSFEIGDSDGDCQTAAFCNNDVDTDGDGVGDGVSVANADRNFDGLPDDDLDGDGLFDWSWSVRFFQPGTADIDDDGVIDGDLADSMHVIGVLFGFPTGGEAIDNGDGTWSIEIDPSVDAAATGAEDVFALYDDDVHAGTFWFGGFACEGEPLPDGPGYTPFASFAFQLWGPAGPGDDCPADFTGEGDLNFFDVSAFIQAFNAMDPSADFQPDGNFNFFDVSAFIQAFNAGCP